MLIWIPRILGFLVFLYLVCILGITTSAYRGLTKSRSDSSKRTLGRCLQEKEFPPEMLDLPWERENVFSPRRDATLAVWALPGKPGEGTIIILHGATWDHYAVMKYAGGFIERGWNVALFDFGGYGDSPPGKLPSPGYGHYEKYDLDAVVDWVRSRFPHAGPLIVAGESMGASTALQYLPLGATAERRDWKIDAVIADCPFSSMADESMALLKRARCPAFVAYPARGLFNILMKIFRGYSIYDVSPLKDALSSPAPVLFIHGGEDDFVPTWMSVCMAEARKEAGLPATVLAIIDGAEHAKSVVVDRDRWFREVFGFIGAYCKTKEEKLNL